jgi:hypothetical protein
VNTGSTKPVATASPPPLPLVLSFLLSSCYNLVCEGKKGIIEVIIEKVVYYESRKR